MTTPFVTIQALIPLIPSIPNRMPMLEQRTELPNSGRTYPVHGKQACERRLRQAAKIAARRAAEERKQNQKPKE